MSLHECGVYCLGSYDDSGGGGDDDDDDLIGGFTGPLVHGIGMGILGKSISLLRIFY